MPTYRLPQQLSVALDPAIVATIEAYRPQRLKPSQWATAQGAVSELTARTEPVSTADAQQQLTALCLFIAWAEEVTGTQDLHVILTVPLVERFAVATAGRMSPSARNHTRARLRRCLRVAAGEPARTKRANRNPGPRPYTGTELIGLAQQAEGCPSLRLVLRLGLEHGIVVPDAYAASVTRRAPLTAAGWRTARRTAAAVGVVLLAARLRATWLNVCWRNEEPFAVAARRRGATRADLENALAYLPTVPCADQRQLLRGCN